MLAFLVSFVPFLFLLSGPVPLKPLPSWVNELRLVFFLFCQELIYYSFQGLRNYALLFMASNLINMLFAMRPSRVSSSAARGVEEEEEMMQGERRRTILLDLPELPLDSILEKLSPAGLCNMAGVCHSLRDRCASDHLWNTHMRDKWGTVFSLSPLPANQDYFNLSLLLPSSSSSRRRRRAEEDQPSAKEKNLSLSLLSWFKTIRSHAAAGGANNHHKSSSSSSSSSPPLPVHSIMSCYLALQSGRIWFPAQVYNRENGSVGFLLSCYDAELSYNSRTDSFYARYPPHGVRTTNIEDGVKWDRIRVSPVDTPAHDLHVSDCLNELRPGDHIEIQWRKCKEYPYGWWYGVVGHLASCDGNKHFCHCHNSESIILEFNQYAPSSRWRQVAIDRKDHREYGNDDADGFYGGIRKLHSKDEISTWKSMWPTKTLE